MRTVNRTEVVRVRLLVSVYVRVDLRARVCVACVNVCVRACYFYVCYLCMCVLLCAYVY